MYNFFKDFRKEAQECNWTKIRYSKLYRSVYCNPLRVVNKKNGDIRLCLDARYINAISEGDKEAQPRIEDILQDGEGVELMSKTDFVCGYW